MRSGDEAAITGIGQSALGRRLGRSPQSLAVESVLAAVADAGLEVGDIDGLSTWPGAGGQPRGFSDVGVWEVQDALGMDLDWFSGGSETAGQLGAVFNAVAAVRAGLATHVVCFRAVWESTAQTTKQRASIIGAGQDRLGGAYQYLIPFGAMSAANWTAMLAQRHFHEYGTTRAQLGAVAVNARANAAHNPHAVFRDPLTLDDYLTARMISEPLCLFDCDVPMDGSTAVVVSRLDAAGGGPQPPLRIAAIGSATGGRAFWDQHEDLTSMAATRAAAMLWRTSELQPADVDVAALYDGFSFLTLVWLEALGFCAKGESGPFVEGGQRIALDGELPLSTGGGQLSGGRLHGFGHLHEAATQLWGRGGDRQVGGGPEVAAVAAGGGPVCGCLLLTRS